MKHTLAVVLAVLFPVSAMAEDADQTPPSDIILPAGESDLSEFLWIKRPVIVFADSPADPRFAEQMELLNDRLDELGERDVVILTDTDPDAASPLRTKLRPRGFMLVLVGKDGTVYLRKPFPWNVRELGRSIDKMPMRQREIRERRGDG
ncbi:DUF4174 domain-containing protein [Aestuariivita sp.]|jgi:hypothetical protein|uniref:DUF4174 domain-containing protein n=1 Tax=Aestuariivita sp. TaxID=1872407 RepID=UPI0021749476|nr:DUF4174 domain-containing protein [Aestuariivita sp.]MCE8006209.1 DUF4174 domain-containing protein [Aestuariivita sp.]